MWNGGFVKLFGHFVEGFAEHIKHRKPDSGFGHLDSSRGFAFTV